MSQPAPEERPATSLPRAHGPWVIRQRRIAYQDPWMRVERDEVDRPDGHPGSYCVVHLKAGVCVVAVDARRHVHLTHEFHYAVGGHTLEGVSGGIDSGESPIDAARRELSEELGITARTWIELGTVDPFTANVLSPTRLFLALGLQVGRTRPEGTEVIERVEMPLDQAVREVFASRITHAPTCEALLRAAYHLGVLATATNRSAAVAPGPDDLDAGETGAQAS